MRAFLRNAAIALIVAAAIWCNAQANHANANTYVPATHHAAKKGHR